MNNSYFDIHAKIGFTKHAGGLDATREVASACKVDMFSVILVVGCGSGVSCRRIASEFSCKIIGVDIEPEMVELARKDTSNSSIEYTVADAKKLPFEDEFFDAVISESVTAFVEDKKAALKEYKRVLKKGGYLGLNEATWIKGVNVSHCDFAMKVIGSLVPETEKDWNSIIRSAGLKIESSRSTSVKFAKEAFSEMRLYGIKIMVRAIYRTIRFYIKDSNFRSNLNRLSRMAIHLPKGFMQNFGFGVYITKKA